ncbi:MAG: DUF1810 domain-containing protein [Aquincola tertiaricarbonis]
MGATGDDPHGLQRFVDAQAPVMAQVQRELAAGRKTSHWMWFVFPQLRGLGRSSTAQHYGIASLDEARAYLAHPVLGPRLRHCAQLLLALPHHRTAMEVLGSPDDLKLHSSMTLFAQAAPQDPLWQHMLARFHGGRADAATLRLLHPGGNLPPATPTA